MPTTITVSTSTTPTPSFPTEVRLRQFWNEGDWVLYPRMHCNSFSFATLPNIGDAVISQRYGTQVLPGSTLYHPPTEFIVTYLVKITYAPGQGDPYERDWYGVIAAESTKDQRQMWQCFDLLYFWDRSPIVYSWVVHEATELVAGQGITFNDDGKPNRSPTEHTFNGETSYVFERTDNTVDYWSTRQIVRYLIRHHYPFETQLATKLPWSISDTELGQLPDDDRPVVKQHGRSPLEILKELVNEYRLTSLNIEVSVTEDDIAFKIPTFTDIPAGSVGANPNVIELDIASANVPAYTRTANDLHRVDQVIVQGGYNIWVTSLSFDAGDLLSAWDTSLETEYISGGSAEPTFPASTDYAERKEFSTRFRSQDQFTPVYRHFKIADDREFGETLPYRSFRRRMLNRIYLLGGLDYTSASPPTPDPDDVIERTPFIVFKVPGELPADTHIFGDTLSQSSWIEQINPDAPFKWSAKIRPLDDMDSYLQIAVQSMPKQVISQAFTAQAWEVDDPALGEWDWKKAYVTLALEEDRRCEGIADATAGEAIENVQVKIIDAGESYRKITIEKDTVIDLHRRDGAPVKMLDEMVIKDDTQLLTNIAGLAAVYYGRDRRSIELELPVTEDTSELRVGQYLTHVTDFDTAFNNIDALITRIRYVIPMQEGDTPASTLGNVTMDIDVNYAEFDPLKL